MTVIIGSGCQRKLFETEAPNQAQSSETAGERADGRPRWKAIKSFAVGEAWAISSDGHYIATIDDQRLRITTSMTGPILHHVAIPISANDLVVTKSCVVSYKRLDPTATQLAVLDIRSGKWTLIDTGASIWAMTVDSSGEGIWVSSGDHTVRHYPKVNLGIAGMTKLVVPGYGGSLTSDATGCIVTEVFPSGITAVMNDATKRWHIEEENPKRKTRVFTTQAGSIYLDSTEQLSTNSHTITRISASTGEPLWETVHTGKYVNIHADQHSGMLGLSVGNPETKVPAKLFLYRTDGKVIMDGRGSRYFSPILVGISDSGHRITVIDGERGLTTLSDAGSTLARRLQLPVTSPDLHGRAFSRISSNDRYLFIETKSNNVQILEALHGE